MNNHKFEITWIPLWKCNFKCPYCVGWFHTNALEFQPLNTIIKAWDNFLNKIQDTEPIIDLIISGGEPTIYPNIFEILQYLTKKGPNIFVCTNLSFNVQDFLNLKFPDNKILFNITFHPSFISLDNFITNLIPIKKYVLNQTINYVADKDNLKNQKEFVKKINDCGIKANPLFFKYVGQTIEKEEFPDKNHRIFGALNSEEEIKIIKEIRFEQHQLSSDYECSKQSSFEKKCLAGYKSVQIFPNGNIRKCALDLTYLGNIFDEDINLFKEPQICKLPNCPHQYSNIIE